MRIRYACVKKLLLSRESEGKKYFFVLVYLSRSLLFHFFARARVRMGPKGERNLKFQKKKKKGAVMATQSGPCGLLTHHECFSVIHRTLCSAFGDSSVFRKKNLFFIVQKHKELPVFFNVSFSRVGVGVCGWMNSLFR